MAFFSPGFMLGAATRATERIDDARERNEELAEEIQKLTKEHSKIAARAISARAVQDSEFISKAKLILSSSDEGKEILKNVGDSKQTLVAIGREATKRMELEKNLTPTMFNKALLSKSITPDGKFKNPYNLVQADLTTNPSEEAKQTEKLGFGQRLLEGLVGKKPTIEEAVAGMTPQMREATLESIRTGQPLAARDPVQFAAGQIEVPVLSAAEMERERRAEERYKKRLEEERKYREKMRKEERDYRAKLRGEELARYDNKRISDGQYKNLQKFASATEAIELDRKRRDLNDDQRRERNLDDQSVKDRLNELESLAGQLYNGNYYKNKNISIGGENLYDAPRRILDEAGERTLSRGDIQYLTENGIDKFINWVKGGRKEEGVGGSIDRSAASVESEEQDQGAALPQVPPQKGEAESLTVAAEAASREAASERIRRDRAAETEVALNITKPILSAAREGLNPETNPKLRSAISNARKAGVSEAVISDALKRASSIAAVEPLPRDAAGAAARLEAQIELQKARRRGPPKSPTNSGATVKSDFRKNKAQQRFDAARPK